MLKKLFLVMMASIFLMTACEPLKGVNLNQMLLNQGKIKSSQSYSVFSLDLSYKKSEVKDKEYLNVLEMLDNMVIHTQTKMQNADTMSIGGFVQLKQGKIPFQLYMDKKQLVLLLDQASKAIRIPIESAGPNNQTMQDMQSKMLAAVVKDLPNPKRINVQTNVSYKVHGQNVKGHKIHAEVDANEAPGLLLKFMDNLSKNEKALRQLARTMNDLNKMAGDDTAVTAAQLKQILQENKKSFNELLPEMKKSGMLDKRNLLKTDILLDKNLNERKSYTEIKLQKLPQDAGGLKGITIKVTSENWNINKKVTAQKIKRKSFLSVDASEEEFLSTLDKKRSVLYRILKSSK
ncbi:hypothetical protein CEF21_06875 [Bacillus sp. FJAT-42376]|uniref:hypothetical protein n=1 Tax=Bacillus sp. FJAT-42376 TaxID=2014076 RepID=UPI000F512607|nr:hypothetical protein [Bacillus sp. FJAT-42376]AZB42037.1 hypothetical protein CEF21_06875 [Bacillus sp. FJAT-42376]